MERERQQNNSRPAVMQAGGLRLGGRPAWEDGEEAWCGGCTARGVAFKCCDSSSENTAVFVLCLVLPVEKPLESAGQCSILAGQL